MNIKKLKDTLVCNTLVYEYDNNVNINTTAINTQSNGTFLYNNILDNCKDIKINNYSCMFLTSSQSLTSNIQYSKSSTPNTFTTALSTISGFIKCDDTELGTATAITYSSNIDNTNMFVVDCKQGTITHHNTLDDTLYYLNFNNTIVLSKEPVNGILFHKNNILHVKIGSKYNKFIVSNNDMNISYTNSNMKYMNISGNVDVINNNTNNNLLINTQYTTISGDEFPCNILTYKNQKTYTNHDIFYNYWDTDSFIDADTLQTGTLQELGNTNIYNTNTFYNKDIEIQPGINSITIPSNIYPYTSLDINDTTFNKTGAFASKSPATSDRIYYNRYDRLDNTVLLCTWLSGDGDNSIWVDRYYNPIKFHEQVMMQTAADKLVFDTYSRKIQLYNNGFFDKQSDLKIVPNQNLKYYHISTDDIDDYIQSLNCVELNTITIKNYNTQNILTTNEFTLNGNTYGEVSTALNTNNNVAISYEGELFDWQNDYYELFSSQSNNCGIRLYKPSPITPILHTYKIESDEQTIHIKIYNLEFDLIDHIILHAQDDKIKNLQYLPDLQYFVLQLEKSVELYTLFGGIIAKFDYSHSIDINNNTDDTNDTDDNINKMVVRSVYATNEFIYILYSNNTLYKYDINSYERVSLNYITSTIDESENNYKMICEDNKTYIYNNTKTDMYVPNYGLLYISNTSEVSGDICIHTSPDTFSQANINNLQYITVQSNKYVDERNETMFTYHPILDFSIANDTIFCVASDVLVQTTLSRDSYDVFTLPIHSQGINDNVFVYNTFNVDSNIKTRTYIILANNKYNTGEIYEFIDNQFNFIKSIDISNDYNMYNLTGRKYNPCKELPLHLNINFKYDNNRIKKYTKQVEDIQSGKHIFLINVNVIDGVCQLFVDTEEKCNIKIDSNYISTYNILQNKLAFGNTLLYHGDTLASYTKNKTYLINNYTIGNVKVFSNALSFNDIRILTLQNKTIPSIILNIPCGQRSSVSKINKVYKQTIPGYKSAHFDVIVKNLRLSNANQQKLTQLIKSYIANALPATTTLDNVTYKDY